ncbi:MAG: hypothetical protein M0Z88_06915 [Actinomycetota bacterium]|nr:hypothetical protein [Actinomycetota bacterium]
MTTETMPETMVERIVAVHRRLDAAEIPHAFGGAIALAYHTLRPRATSGIDINVALPGAEAERVFRSMPPQVEWTGQLIRVARAREEVRLRWLRSGSIGLFFAKDDYYQLVEERKEIQRFAGTSLPVISATDLTVFKTLFNRPQDWVDIAEMLKAGTVDASEALRWAEHLGGVEGGDRLRRALATAPFQRVAAPDHPTPPTPNPITHPEDGIGI